MFAKDRKFHSNLQLILFKHILLLSILVNNRIIVIVNRQKIFQLQLSTFENSQLQLQRNCMINYNFINYNYNFSKPGLFSTGAKSGSFCVKKFTFGSSLLVKSWSNVW